MASSLFHLIYIEDFRSSNFEEDFHGILEEHRFRTGFPGNNAVYRFVKNKIPVKKHEPDWFFFATTNFNECETTVRIPD